MSDGESDGDKRASKKRKASRACDRCNVQHQPCDNAIPKCSVCERAGTDCTYNRPIRKRGPRTGYTAQFGERLWGLVLRANPDLEDVVLQLLASGMPGDTGVSNADYFKNNDNQSELVNRFNESRLGKFVHNGELPSLDELRKTQASAQANAHLPAANKGDQGTGDGETLQSHGRRSRRSTVSVTSKPSPSVNPHGPIQNPGDIYTLSEDIRKRSSHADVDGLSQTQRPSPSQNITQTPDWHSFSTSANNNTSLPFEFMPDSFTHDYGSLLRTPVQNGRGISEVQSSSKENNPAKSVDELLVNRNISGVQTGTQSTDFDFPDINQWYDSIPTDTLLNLGFTGGEGMAQDFLELCENPDPVESAPISPSGQDEDEEAVWRRLVMRGRFV
ncbi:hypothetical protein TruAng_007712 [Truncatella angustata]|nr:hypothetical protein TruAng_007712 [Truncatella angustata]